MKITYDKRGDVLYLTIHDEPSYDNVFNSEEGILYRYNKDKLTGITVLNFLEHIKKSELSDVPELKG